MLMKRIIAILMACLAVCVAANAQSGKVKKKYRTTDDKKAYALYKEGSDIQTMAGNDPKATQAALDKYLQAIERDPQFIDALYSASECYMDLKQPGNQINCIKQAVPLDSTYWVRAYYNCAVALCQKGQFDEALQWFDLYDKFMIAKSKGKGKPKDPDPQWRKMAMAKMELMKNPVPFNPEYPSDYIRDTPFETYWPSISLDENELVVTSRLPRDTVAFNRDPSMIGRINNDETQEDMYIMRRDEETKKWKPLEPIYRINTDFNEGTQSLSPDGRWMFYTACGYKDSKGSCDIYFSQRTRQGWSKGVNIGGPVNTEEWESQPCFAADGKTLYFVRGTSKSTNRRGNIMRARITGTNAQGVPIFGKVYNLGDSINTDGDESHPFIHPDGKTLYFSSDTWPGLGGKDIFVSRLRKGKWSKPVNIGYPINTVDDDEGFVVTASGTTGFYNSIRTVDGRRKREVKMFELYKGIRPKAVPFVRGVITDCDTKASIEATISLDRLSDGKNVAVSRALADGSFTLGLPGAADYLLSVNAKGYFFHSQKFSVSDVTKMHGPLTLTSESTCLTPLKVGRKIALRNIYFDTDKYEIKPESKVELDIVVQIMKENPEIRVEISGHTDNRASVKHNQVLSMNRAKSTVEYLVQHGIDRSRFEIKGYGLSMPCATNDTEEGRQLNRRIEAKIIE